MVFLDTNLIVYAYDGRDVAKQDVAKKIVTELSLSRQAAISTQVVQEFCNVALKPAGCQLKTKDLVTVLQNTILPLVKHTPTADFYLRTVSLLNNYSLSWYDALIVQSALDLNCTYLYSEDLQSGQQIGTLTITNPFI